MRYRWVIAVLTALLTLNTTAETLELPVDDHSRPPTTIISDGKISGIYPDIYRAILKQAGLEATLIPMPPMRIRIGFETAQYPLTCCDNPSWRLRPKEQEIQIFSIPFYWSKDIFIFPLNQDFPIQRLSQLSDKKVATVRGLGYRGEEYFGERYDYHNEKALMQALALGRADVGIINENIFLTSQEQALLTAGPVQDQASVHIRIHRNRMDLVEPINHAISELIRSGERDKIVNGYLNPVAEDQQAADH